jgi:hypothetical protein
METGRMTGYPQLLAQLDEELEKLNGDENKENAGILMQQLKNGKKDVQGVETKSIKQGNRHKP